MSTLRLIVTLLLLLFTMTILGEDDPAAVEKKSEEDITTSLEGQKRNSDSENPRIRRQPGYYSPYAGVYPMQPYPWMPPHHPSYPTYSGVFPQHLASPLMSMLYPSWHQQVGGHPEGHYPYYGHGHYGHMGYHGQYGHGQYGHMHWPFPTNAIFYPHTQHGGFCNFDKTFLCWGMSYCIKPGDICDDVDDCPNKFDEERRLCVEGRRPSVDSIAHFLEDQSWLRNLFTQSKNVHEIARVLKSAESLDELKWTLNVTSTDFPKLQKAFQDIRAKNSDFDTPLKALHMPDAVAEIVKYFFKLLMDTGLVVA